MAWLPGGEKISKISLFILAQLTNVTDIQTDRRPDTACRHIPRLCIASRGKNCAVGMLQLTTDKHEASRGLSATAELLVKARVAAVTCSQYIYVGFSRRNKIPCCSTYTISEKAMRFRHPDYNADRAEKLISCPCPDICRHVKAAFHYSRKLQTWLQTWSQTFVSVSQAGRKHVES